MRSSTPVPAIASVGASTATAKPAATPPSTVAKSLAAPVVNIDASAKVPWRMWLLALAFIPLFWHVFRGDLDIASRLADTLIANPQLVENFEDMPVEELMRQLPDHKLVGAHLAYDSWMHWAYAGLSAVAFLAAAFMLFEVGRAQPHHLLLSALTTATIGILVLLAFQWIADFTQGYWMTRGNIFILALFYVVKLIGFSYYAADNPEYGFLASFAGFTFGVGLCEELVKALPVIFRVQSNERDGWRTACAWGFASGVGFGTAEGIMYSSQYYNGLADGSIYFVRFISCVALHAIWSAAVGVTVWRNRDKFHSELDWADWLLLVLSITGVPMILHGLYDTLLKREYDGWASLTALASIAWLFISIAYALRGEAARIATAKQQFERQRAAASSQTVRFH